MAGAEHDKDEAAAVLAALSRRFVALERSRRASIERIERLGLLADIDAYACAELNRILAVSGVRCLEVAGGAVRVQTAAVHLQADGAVYNLGEYRIVLDLNGDVRIESLAHLGPKAHWDHPHVQDGLPCLGNLREGILKLIAEYQLALTVQVLIDFLHTYQPETAYCPLEGWPRLS